MRIAPSTLALLTAALLAAPAAVGQEAPAAEAPAATAEAPLPQRLQAAGAELRQVLTSPDAVLDPAQRSTNRDEVVPAILKMRGLLAEGIEAGMVPPGATGEFDMMLALYGHEETVDRLETEAQADGPAADGSFGSLVAAQAFGAEDADGRAAAIDRFADRAAERPESDALVGVGGMLMSLPGMGDAQQERVMGVLKDTLTSDTAAQAVAALEQEAGAEDKLASLVGKPLVLEGSTADGDEFSTADWKGKVVLVDFWATWCGPCIAELPKVKKAFADYQDQGLEVLGVSCDKSAEDVTSFVAEQDGMDWPNLFEEGQNGWHPLATELGVRGIPTMFLIDRAGIVRSVTARQDYKEMIPILLAEEAPAPEREIRGPSAFLLLNADGPRRAASLRSGPEAEPRPAPGPRERRAQRPVVAALALRRRELPHHPVGVDAQPGPLVLASSVDPMNANSQPCFAVWCSIAFFTIGSVASVLLFSWPSVMMRNTTRAGRSASGIAARRFPVRVIGVSTASCSGVVPRGSKRPFSDGTSAIGTASKTTSAGSWLSNCTSVSRQLPASPPPSASASCCPPPPPACGQLASRRTAIGGGHPRPGSRRRSRKRSSGNAENRP